MLCPHPSVPTPTHVTESLLDTQASSHAKIIEVNKRIASLGASRKLTQALDLFRGVPASGLQPTIVTYNVILYACVRCGALDIALQIFRELMASVSAGGEVVPTVVTFTTVLKGLCQSGDLVAAERLVGEMQRHGVPPNLRTVNMFLRGCLWHGFAEEALTCYHHLGDWSLVRCFAAPLLLLLLPVSADATPYWHTLSLKYTPTR